MIREYWKKKYVPKSCPECGSEYKRIPSNPTVTDLFKWGYSNYHIKLIKHPTWKIPCWVSDCGKCSMSSMFSRISSNYSVPIVLSFGDE